MAVLAFKKIDMTDSGYVDLGFVFCLCPYIRRHNPSILSLSEKKKQKKY